MIKYLLLPKIGMNMVEGTIVEWLVKPGDPVKKDQIVVRAETDKAVQDIFATESGTVLRLLADCGDTVECQSKIAVLGDEGDVYEPADMSGGKEEKTEASPAEPEQGHTAAPAGPAAPSRGVRISPLAKRIAKGNGIRPEDIPVPAGGRRIVKNDVLAYLEQLSNKAGKGPVPAEEDEFVPYSGMRRAIAAHMTESANRKPRVCLHAAVDCVGLIRLREQMKARHKLSYNEIIAKACARALEDYPRMNAVTADGGILIKKHINIGIAVDTENGLVVPVLRDVNRKGLFALADEFSELADKVKRGKHSLDEIQGGSFTVTNLGMFGVESFDPILNSPECFILGVGCMKKVPAVYEDKVSIRTQMVISLSFDHAAFDGAAAGKLLKAIKEYLEQPELMLS